MHNWNPSLSSLIAHSSISFRVSTSSTCCSWSRAMISHDSPPVGSQAHYCKFFITLRLNLCNLPEFPDKKMLILHATNLGKMQSEIKTTGPMLKTVIQLSIMGDHPVTKCFIVAAIAEKCNSSLVNLSAGCWKSWRKPLDLLSYASRGKKVWLVNYDVTNTV